MMAAIIHRAMQIAIIICSCNSSPTLIAIVLIIVATSCIDHNQLNYTIVAITNKYNVGTIIPIEEAAEEGEADRNFWVLQKRQPQHRLLGETNTIRADPMPIQQLLAPIYQVVY